MTNTITRRRMLAAGAALAVPAGALPALATTGDDAELARLWAEHIAATHRTTAARQINRKYRERIGERAYVKEIDASGGAGTSLWQAFSDAGADGDRIIDEILATPAASLLGVGVKLAAQPTDADIGYDARQAMTVALNDINARLGTTFALPIDDDQDAELDGNDA